MTRKPPLTQNLRREECLGIGKAASHAKLNSKPHNKKGNTTMIRVIQPHHTREDLPPASRQWLDLHNRNFVTICAHGCHGKRFDTYDEALAAIPSLDADCNEDQNPSVF